MTSNIGSQYLNDPALSAEQKSTGALQALRAAFPPEFLNRVDDIVVFHALDRSDLEKIVDIQLGRLHRMLVERGLTLELTEAARRFLAGAGYDPTYGARPLKRAIQQYVQDPLAMELLEGHFRAGDHIVADLAPQGDRLTFTRQVVAEPVTV
jgi:ATP-dependent Clp protease ATP-binding subunit ClpB